jgi:[acyl-carrier-protein] S-malonyltransferase
MTVKTALVFPGQGSQRPGMLDAVPENEALDRLLDAAEALTGLDLRDIAATGDEADLADTRVAQPLLYLADWAWGSALLDSGLKPAACAGHSLGEIAALATAGVFSVEAGLELVVERSRLMATTAASTPGAMAAVLGLQREAIDLAIDGIGDVWTANDNAPGQIVISGTPAGVAAASEALTAAGARKVVPLKVAGAFHSPLMQPARDRFAEVIEGASFSDASMPVYQNTDPSPATAAEVIRARLIDQITRPVRWTETMEALARDGVTLLVEAGPGSVLAGLARRVTGLSAVSAESAGIERVLEEVLS